MRHHNTKRTLGRTRNQHKALMRSLACNLIVRSRIKTTLAKAKELQPFIEKLITRAKNNSVANRRIVASRIHQAKEVKKLFDNIAPQYKERSGGYTRILKLGQRKSDSAEMAIIEFV